MPISPFIALTDKNWFDHLKRNANADHIVDEANFWSPKAQTPPAKMEGDSLVLTIYRSKAAATLALGKDVTKSLSKAEWARLGMACD
jgi:hypothetical protein